MTRSPTPKTLRNGSRFVLIPVREVQCCQGRCLGVASNPFQLDLKNFGRWMIPLFGCSICCLSEHTN